MSSTGSKASIRVVIGSSKKFQEPEFLKLGYATMLADVVPSRRNFSATEGVSPVDCS